MNSKQIKEELKASRIATVECPCCCYRNEYDNSDNPELIFCILCGALIYLPDEARESEEKENEQQAD